MGRRSIAGKDTAKGDEHDSRTSTISMVSGWDFGDRKASTAPDFDLEISEDTDSVNLAEDFIRRFNPIYQAEGPLSYDNQGDDATGFNAEQAANILLEDEEFEISSKERGFSLFWRDFGATSMNAGDLDAADNEMDADYGFTYNADNGDSGSDWDVVNDTMAVPEASGEYPSPPPEDDARAKPDSEGNELTVSIEDFYT
ncbi:hypothetical protein CYMTET_7573 [Cymbomonas tetramitiformis]|uniref:Uncharacterized protein n=1 Tax=Cymbomonas tetramitiformis TaxID=36881 RepID=A0AAE0LHC6_9CHLO|nr:hypothetical protein CYMTET_7573 [Cymbomonas tetramitiformis]